MDLFIPIAIGFVVNAIIFTICRYVKQSYTATLKICFYSFLIVLIASFLVGRWIGLGIAVMSSGMLAFVILLAVILIFASHKSNIK